MTDSACLTINDKNFHDCNDAGSGPKSVPCGQFQKAIWENSVSFKHQSYYRRIYITKGQEQPCTELTAWSRQKVGEYTFSGVTELRNGKLSYACCCCWMANRTEEVAIWLSRNQLGRGELGNPADLYVFCPAGFWPVHIPALQNPSAIICAPCQPCPTQP